MKLNQIQFGLAIGAAIGIFWILCSAFVFLSPMFTMDMTGHMMHASFQGLHWTLTPLGVFLGFIGWIVVGIAFGWLVALFYNYLGAKEEVEK
jgi:hypothetical protein